MKRFPTLQNNIIKGYFEDTCNVNRSMIYLLWLNLRMNTSMYNI